MDPWLDPAVAQYAIDHSTPPDDVQRRLIAETSERLGERATMQISSDEGVFLQLLTQLSGARTAVEVGTFTGYSALCIARGLPEDGRCCAATSARSGPPIGRRYWAEAGRRRQDRPAHRARPPRRSRALPADTRFDLAFIDADKSSYGTYYEEILARMDPGGLILVDNTIWSGRVLDDAPADRDTAALIAFNAALAADDRVDVVVLTFRDGVTMARKR